MRSSSFPYRLSFLVLTALAATAATACGEDIPLYSFPRQMCGETAIQGAADSSKTDALSVTLAASDGERLFWVVDDYNSHDSTAGVIHAGSLAGGDDVVIATDKLLPTQIAVDAEQIYWGGGSADGGGTAIKAVDKQGGTPRIVATVEAAYEDSFGRAICQGGGICPYRFAVDATDIYYGANDTLRRVDKRRHLSVPVELWSGRIASVAVDATDVYWVACTDDNSLAKVMKLAKSGGAPTELASVDGGFNCTRVADRLVLDEAAVYWSVATSVYSVPKGGGVTTTISGAGTYVSALAVTATDLYWVTSGADHGDAFSMGGHHSLVRSSKSGGAPVDLIPAHDDQLGTNDNSCDPLNITVDDKNLYWVVMGGVLRRPLQGAAQ